MSGTVFNMFQFRIVQIVITVGLILSIAGGTSSTTSTGAYKVQTSSKIGIILYILAYLALCLIALMTTIKLSRGSTGEKRLVFAVLAALPLIFVRLVYSALSVFAHSHDFNPIDGSIAVLVVMAVLEEFAVVLIYLLVGMKTQPMAAAQLGPITARPWKGDLGSHRSSHRRQGPVHSLIGLAVTAAQAHG